MFTIPSTGNLLEEKEGRELTQIILRRIETTSIGVDSKFISETNIVSFFKESVNS